MKKWRSAEADSFASQERTCLTTATAFYSLYILSLSVKKDPGHSVVPKIDRLKASLIPRPSMKK